MGDASYDVAIIGGGNKALVTAIYLAKYGQMKVALFEERHELGGGWGSHEAAAPGFISNTHASTIGSWYFLPLTRDFPEIEGMGLQLLHHKVAVGIILEEDQSCLCVYHAAVDPSGERTAKEIARFAGQADADRWMRVLELNNAEYGLRQALLEDLFSLPPSPGEPTPLDRWLETYMRRPGALLDRRFFNLSANQAARESWQHKGLQYLVLRVAKAVGFPTEVGEGGLVALRGLTLYRETSLIKGGTHSAAHACQRMLLEQGGQFFTKSRVTKIIVDAGKARGIRLEDGTEVEAKLVVAAVDPYQLCFDLIGPEHLSDDLLRKVASLEHSLTCITWYTWALHHPLDYRSSSFNPDINDCQWVILGNQNVDSLVEEAFWRRLGKVPPDLHIVNFHHHSLADVTQAPAGKHVVGSEIHTVPAYCLSERQWMDYKRRHAEETMTTWQGYVANVGWEDVIGYDAITPYDTARRQRNMAPAGNWAVVDRIPGQNYPYNPTPELAAHRTPIQGLYATGVAWGRFVGAHCGQGYTCYKAIAEDLGLAKPWSGQPW